MQQCDDAQEYTSCLYIVIVAQCVCRVGVFSLLSGLLESVDEDKEEKEGIDHKCDLNP